MGFFRSIGVAGWAWRHVGARVARGGLWGPFLLLALVQGVFLLWLLAGLRPWMQPVTVPVIRAVGGEAGLHYPIFYSVLPVLYARLDMVLGVLLGALVGGAATVAFARAFGHPPGEGGSWALARARYLHLVVYYAIVGALIFGVFSIQHFFPAHAMLANRSLRWGVRLGTLGLAILVQGLLVYGTAWIVLRRANGLAAFGSSVRTAGSTFLATLLIVGVPAVLQYPLAYLQGRGELFTTKFTPEIMVWVLVAWIVVQIPLGFVMTGAATAVFLRREEGGA